MLPAAANLSRTPRILLILAAIVIVVAGLRAFAEPLSAFLLAALIAILCAPLQRWLRGRGLSQGASLAIVLAVILLVGVLLVVFTTVSANQLIRRLPEYEAQIDQLQATTEAELERLGLFEQAVTALETFDLQSLIPLASSILRAILDSFGNVLLIFLFLVYMLLDAPNIPTRLRAVLGEDSPWLIKANEFVYSVQRYMILKTVFGVIIAAIQTVMMILIGVDFALQWGVLAVIANYIPNIGFVIGLVPPVAVTLLEKGVLTAVFLVVAYSVINNVIENFVAPRFMSEELGISSLFIFISLIFWTWVLGASGALLAVPLTLFVKIMLLDGEEGARGLLALVSEGKGEASAS